MLRIYMLKSGERDNDVYVETDKVNRNITLIISDVRSAYGIDTIAAKFPNISVNVQKNEDKDNYTATITLKLPESQSALEEQKNKVQSLLAKLNTESYSNYFYLNRTDFFHRQFESFAKSCGLELNEVCKRQNQSESSRSSSFAF